jgi:GNAT superfamily N-acetyltransferase
MTAGHHATVATIHDSTVVATAVLSTSDDTVTIEHLAVGHPHRGQGLATILLHSIPHLAEQALTNPPTLYTGTCPARAAGLYARCGYTVLPHSPIDPTRCTFTKTPGWH